MNPILFKNFVKDVGELYCKTHVASIEDCFIRLSQATNNTDITDFMAWIGDQKKSKSGVKSLLAQPNIILPAFEYVANVNTRVNAINKDTKASDEFQQQLFTHNPQEIEFINTMASLLGDFEVSSILIPFIPAFTLIAKRSRIPPHNQEMVKKDLITLMSNYKTQQVQQAETLKESFVVLLNKFSQDVGKALENIGRKDLADKIVGGKLLFRPDLLSQVVQIGHVDPYMGEKVNEIVRHCFYEARGNVEAMYDYIKREALDFVGAIDKRYQNVQQETQQADQDLASIQQGKGLNDKTPSSINTNDIELLQPRSLAMISTTLYALYRRLQRFSSY